MVTENPTPERQRRQRAPTRNATSTRCSRRRRRCSRRPAWTRPRRRSPTWPASASARSTGTSRSARTWSKAVVPARDRRLRRRGPGTERRARAGRRAHAVARPVHRASRHQTRARRGPALRRPGLRRPARLLPGSGSAPPSRRCSTPPRPRARSAPTSAPRTCCTPSPSCACPCPDGGPSTAAGSSACWSTGCAVEAGRDVRQGDDGNGGPSSLTTNARNRPRIWGRGPGTCTVADEAPLAAAEDAAIAVNGAVSAARFTDHGHGTPVRRVERRARVTREVPSVLPSRDGRPGQRRWL